MEEGAVAADVCLNSTYMSKPLKDLERLLLQTIFPEFETHDDPKFENWKTKTARTIKKIFGENSDEYQDFSRIEFWFHYAGERYEGMVKEEYDRIHFQKGLKKAELLLEDLVEDAKVILESITSVPTIPENRERKIFISHASKDNQLGLEIINLLQLIGVDHEKIFYTSADGYGIQLGANWTDSLKKEIGGEVTVLSLITENYFQSQICLCELGAAWVLSKKHIPILVPSLSFKEMNEIIAKNQGFEITNSVKWSSLKRNLESDFGLKPLPEDKWEPQRDAILNRIKDILKP